jgi:hypothetical protein
MVSKSGGSGHHDINLHMYLTTMYLSRLPSAIYVYKPMGHYLLMYVTVFINVRCGSLRHSQAEIHR